MDQIKETRISSTEQFLTLLSGLRKVPVITSEDRAYNTALADVFDYFIVNEPNYLRSFTVNQGKWVKD
jgi:hypothetical protein